MNAPLYRSIDAEDMAAEFVASLSYPREAAIRSREAALNAATLTYSVVQEIGHDAHDAWWAMLAMYGFCDPRIHAGYSFEAAAAGASFFLVEG